MSMPLFRRLKNNIKHFNAYFLLYSKTKQPNSTDKEEVVTNRLQAKSRHKHKHKLSDVPDLYSAVFNQKRSP